MGGKKTLHGGQKTNRGGKNPCQTQHDINVRLALFHPSCSISLQRCTSGNLVKETSSACHEDETSSQKTINSGTSEKITANCHNCAQTLRMTFNPCSYPLILQQPRGGSCALTTGREHSLCLILCVQLTETYICGCAHLVVCATTSTPAIRGRGGNRDIVKGEG